MWIYTSTPIRLHGVVLARQHIITLWFLKLGFFMSDPTLGCLQNKQNRGQSFSTPTTKVIWYSYSVISTSNIQTVYSDVQLRCREKFGSIPVSLLQAAEKWLHLKYRRHVEMSLMTNKSLKYKGHSLPLALLLQVHNYWTRSGSFSSSSNYGEKYSEILQEFETKL
jgi:hypothetical protein